MSQIDRLSDDERAELIRRARDGDAEARERLFGILRGRLEDMARNQVGTWLRARVSVSDIVQSTCREVIEGLEQFRGESYGELDSWAGRILNNTVRKKARYYDAEKRREPDDPSPQRATPVESPPRAEPSDLALAKRVMSSLPQEHREVIVWRLIEGKGYEEIAALTGLSVPGARTRYFRARAQMALLAQRIQPPKADE